MFIFLIPLGFRRKFTQCFSEEGEAEEEVVAEEVESEVVEDNYLLFSNALTNPNKTYQKKRNAVFLSLSRRL